MYVCNAFLSKNVAAKSKSVAALATLLLPQMLPSATFLI